MAHTGPHKKERSGLPTYGAGADWHLASQSQYMRMMEISRDYVNNDPIVSPGIKRLVSNIVGDGFTPDPDTGDPEVDIALSDMWAQWSQTPEVRRCGSFPDIERQTLLAILRDGDILPIPVIDYDGVGRLQIFEGHQVRDPASQPRGDNELFCGVERDGTGRIVAYHVAPDVTRMRPQSGGPAKVRIPAYDAAGNSLAFFTAFPDRITQTRGIPIIQPAHDFISYHDDIQFAQLVKQQIASCFVLLRSKQTGAPVFGGKATHATSETFADGTTRATEQLYPGKQIFGDEGETIQGFSPNVPNSEYFDHVALILQIIAVNLGLPLQVLLLDPTKTNFSGWRGALDQAKQKWRETQDTFARRFHTRVWQWKAREWAATLPYFMQASNRLPNYTRCIWHTPAWPYIEPLTDAQADAYQIQARLNSPRRVFAKRGLQYDTVIQEIVSDNKDAITLAMAAANEINSSNPESPVSWRDLLSVPVPGPLAVNMSADPESEEPSGAIDATTSNES